MPVCVFMFVTVWHVTISTFICTYMPCVTIYEYACTCITVCACVCVHVCVHACVTICLCVGCACEWVFMCHHVFDRAFVYGCACECAFVCYYHIAQFIARGNIDGSVILWGKYY